MKILLVEDNSQDQILCRNAVEDFCEDNDCVIAVEVASSIEDAIHKITSEDYDGVIVDMRLADKGNEGNEILDVVKSHLMRIPVAIMTATPDVADRYNVPLIGDYRKGDDSYSDIVRKFWEVFNTGITKIMGVRGEIEKKLSAIFSSNMIPQIDGWVSYGKVDPVKTEKALIRHVLNHLVVDLDEEVDLCYPEEFYIYPLKSDRVNTGRIYQKIGTDKKYVILNPACDLADRGEGTCNTDRALLVEIEHFSDIIPGIDLDSLSGSKKDKLKKIYKNNQNLYYHCLPKSVFFDGGVVNFRYLNTVGEGELSELYESVGVQVSPAFVKDLVARFSSYYSRQGQPDLYHQLF